MWTADYVGIQFFSDKLIQLTLKLNDACFKLTPMTNETSLKIESLPSQSSNLSNHCNLQSQDLIDKRLKVFWLSGLNGKKQSRMIHQKMFQ